MHILKTNFDVPAQGDGDESRDKVEAAVKELVAFDKVLPIEDNDIVSPADPRESYMRTDDSVFGSTDGARRGGPSIGRVRTSSSP